MANRITPVLGPDLNQAGQQNYFDMISSPTKPSYALGTKVTGSDGHTYVYVKAAADIAASGTDVIVTEGTWIATAGAGAHETPIANIKSGDFFHARQITL